MGSRLLTPPPRTSMPPLHLTLARLEDVSSIRAMMAAAQDPVSRLLSLPPAQPRSRQSKTR
jgi:hypothetical protein